MRKTKPGGYQGAPFFILSGRNWSLVSQHVMLAEESLWYVE
jgi:hypothetical protein